ncbi:MAG: ECF transporter S component [Candidatus Bathyarchaeota archaeon]|nr:ECF transporter S component [Candidatus Bathyarchaeota archaeon]MDH5732405.1 ECF transporter S component [Candidatus Bathyarchaeota archaeon]
MSTRDVAYVAVFAALSVIVIKLVPGFPIIGLSDSDIKFNAALAPIYGMVLGPYLGFLSAFIGGIVVVDNVFSVFISFSRGISAFVAGLLTQKSYRLSGRTFPGWSVAAAVLSLLILGWYSTWVGQQVPFFPILHISGLLVILVTRGWVATVFKKCEQKGQRWTANLFYLLSGISTIVLAYILPKLSFSSIEFFSYLFLFLYLWGGIMVLYGLFGIGIREGNFTAAICLASYCSIITDHMIGNLAYIVLLSPTPESFIAALPVSAVERSIFTAIATVVGVGVILALRRSGLFSREL